MINGQCFVIELVFHNENCPTKENGIIRMSTNKDTYKLKLEDINQIVTIIKKDLEIE